MNKRITQALTRLFDKSRIVFWYDAKEELEAIFAELDLDGVEKLEIKNNEFGLKYHILREKADQKFLLYKKGPEPHHLDNWLLNVQLYSQEFRTDQGALWLSELGLGPEFSELTFEHAAFFQSTKRREALKHQVREQSTLKQVRMVMLSICAGADARPDAVLENLLLELAEDKDEKIKLIARCQLDTFLWAEALQTYEYASQNLSIKDFALRLFGDCFEMGISPGSYHEARKQERLDNLPPSRMSSEALVFLKRWKDNRRLGQAFATLSDQNAQNLDIERKLNSLALDQVFDLDYFRLIDQKIIVELIQAVIDATMSAADIEQYIRQRRTSYWYEELYAHLYQAIEYAALFRALLHEAQLIMHSFEEGIERYVGSWFKLDQYYRKFIFHYSNSHQPTLLESLAELMDNLYTNNFLVKINDAWHTYVDGLSPWQSTTIDQQRHFYQQHVRHVLERGKKIFVIISDALRYEAGEELLSLIRQEDRYEAELVPALSMLPSFTQLGMAALLPHKELSMLEDKPGIIFVDQTSSQGTENRTKILQKAHAASKAMVSKDLMDLNQDEARALVRDHDLLYIYQDYIDKVGHSRDTEERAFEAVEQTLKDLVRIVKKLAAANASNLIITADHGFIYQHSPLDISDFSDQDLVAESIFIRDRRFVLGKNFQALPGLTKFSAQTLGLAGDFEVQIPKSITRLRQQGTGSRYVHGGASFQEVIIPVLKVNKKRQSDVQYVDVEIFRGASSLITSGQLVVTLYQVQPAEEKMQPRLLRLALFSLNGEMISDSHEQVFDFESTNSRDREVQVQLILSREAEALNGQDVLLLLEEKIPDTAQYKEYKHLRYTLRRSFSSDFD